MSFNLIATLSGLNKLKQTSFNLGRIRQSVSSEEFGTLLKEFECELDRLNILLVDQFGSDSEVMQLVFELKSLVIMLKYNNVETS